MSMDGFGFSRVNPEYNDTRRPSFNQQARIIDFVMLDATGQPDGGLAYQLIKEMTYTEEELKDIKEGVFPLPRPPFSLLGDVRQVKLSSKQLILSDGNTIQWSHLVVVRGNKPSMMSYEFLSGLYALVDALRIQKWVPAAMQFPKSKGPKVVIHASRMAKDSNPDLWVDHFPAHSEAEGTFIYAEANRKLYEVHL